VGATLAGGDLREAVRFGLSVPDQNTVLLPVHAPANGLVASEQRLAALEATELPYKLVLQYDFRRYGGKKEWVARYDGEDLLYFAQPFGVAGAGWYETSSRLASKLKTELFWAKAPPKLARWRPEPVMHTLFRATAAIGVPGLVLFVWLGRRAWFANASPTEMHERLAAWSAYPLPRA
jgi:hypothetical protein